LVHSHQVLRPVPFQDRAVEEISMEALTTSAATPKSIPFDPVCGSPLPALYEANPYCDGGYTYYFCSSMCRRFFIDQRDAERQAELAGEPPSSRPTACA